MTRSVATSHPAGEISGSGKQGDNYQLSPLNLPHQYQWGAKGQGAFDDVSPGGDLVKQPDGEW